MKAGESESQTETGDNGKKGKREKSGLKKNPATSVDKMGKKIGNRAPVEAIEAKKKKSKSKNMSKSKGKTPEPKLKPTGMKRKV